MPTAVADSESAEQYAPATGSSGSGLDAKTALAEVMARMGSKVVLKAQIASNPKGARTGPWFYATVACSDESSGGCIPAVWQADLMQGATAELMDSSSSNLANVIVGSTILVRLPDGTVSNYGGDQGDVASGQQFSGARSTDGELESAAKAVLVAAGLKPAEVSVLKPLGPALSVVATVPSAQLGHLSSLQSLADKIGGRNPAKVEGLSIELESEDGAPIARLATAYRSGAGHLWYDPKYESDLDVAHG